MQGVLHMSKRSTEEGSVHVGRQGSALLGQIHVKGNNALNRALHGDVVAGTCCRHFACVICHIV